MGATNEPWSIDEAILRPGRFDEKIYVPPPDLTAREKIFEMGLNKLKISKGFDFKQLALQTEGYSGADIAYIVRKVGEKLFMESVENGTDRDITMQDVLDTIKTVRPSIDKNMLEKFEKFANLQFR